MRGLLTDNYHGHLATNGRNFMRHSSDRKPAEKDVSAEMISIPPTLGTLWAILTEDPFHVTTSFLDVSGDVAALLTTMSFYECFFQIVVVSRVFKFG